MSDLSQELRCKIDEDTHRRFHALCQATGDDAAARLRQLVSEWIERELHAHTLRCRLLRCEGLDGELQGQAGGAA